MATLGLSFAVSPSFVPKRDLVVESEKKLRHLHNTIGVKLARSRFLNILKNAKSPLRNLSPRERAALRDLKSDNAVVVLTADQEKETVVVNEIDYDNKMLDILNNPDHFGKLARNSIPKSEHELVKHLSDLKKKDRLNEKMCRGLFSSDGETPKIFDLPNVRKTNWFSNLQPPQNFGGVAGSNNRQ